MHFVEDKRKKTCFSYFNNTYHNIKHGIASPHVNDIVVLLSYQLRYGTLYVFTVTLCYKKGPLLI